jgi:hypothetical protein
MTQQERMIQAFQDSQAQSLEHMQKLRIDEMPGEMMREMERSRHDAERERKVMQEERKEYDNLN